MTQMESRCALALMVWTSYDLDVQLWCGILMWIPDVDINRMSQMQYKLEPKITPIEQGSRDAIQIRTQHHSHWADHSLCAA